MNKTLIVSQDIYKESETVLLNSGYSLIKISNNSWMENAVSSHPDMYMTNIRNKLLFDSNLAHLFETPIYAKNVIECNRGVDKQKCREYPHNVGFNCLNVGNKLICNKKYTCNDVLRYADLLSLEIINVNQGYAKCSTCVIDDNAIITEDESIAKIVSKHNIEVLLIKKGFVQLKGYNYGFIGGCCGMLDNHLLAFNGSIKSHPSCDEIEKFCHNRSVDILNLCDRELYDIGSIIKIN